jgi:hypothetical protein
MSWRHAKLTSRIISIVAKDAAAPRTTIRQRSKAKPSEDLMVPSWPWRMRGADAPDFASVSPVIQVASLARLPA